MDDLAVHAEPLDQKSSSPRGWSGDLLREVDRFLFGATQCVHADALRVKLKMAPDQSLDPSALLPGQFRRLVERVAPGSAIDLFRLTQNWHSRLALLDAKLWLNLGFTLSVLPFCGHVQRSMDGNFRRALREQFGGDAAALLDEQAGKGPPLQFMLGAGAWKQPQLVAAGGVSAAFSQLCHWDDAVRDRFTLQFDPMILAAPPSVAGLDKTWLEIACKLTLQDHLWLWS
jgi:hypothetical protein